MKRMNWIFRSMSTSLSRIHLIDSFYLTVSAAAGSMMLQSSLVRGSHDPRRSEGAAVPISDTYIVQYLFDGTSDVPAQIHWCDTDGEQVGYKALVEDVNVFLEPVYSRAGSRLLLKFRHNGEEFRIIEP